MVTESFFLILFGMKSTWQPLVIDFFPDMKACQNAITEIGSTPIPKLPGYVGGFDTYGELYRMKCIPKQVD